MNRRERRPVSRLRWCGVGAFVAGVAVLIGGAFFKAGGTELFIVLWGSFALVTIACALFLIDVVTQWVNRRKDERERIASTAG